MRLLLIIILGVFLATYAWGWFVHVQDGLMDTKNYTEYYWREVKDQTRFFLEELGKLGEMLKRPVTRPKEKEIVY